MQTNTNTLVAHWQETDEQIPLQTVRDRQAEADADNCKHRQIHNTQKYAATRKINEGSDIINAYLTEHFLNISHFMKI